MNIHKFKQLPIMGILRGIDQEMVDPIVDVAQANGLKTLEITLNTPDAPKLIEHMVRSAHGQLTIGAGTVLTLDGLKSALDAGASFIVLPTLEEEIVAYCVSHKIPVFPGALTPNEIYRAWRAGAAMVKVFPAQVFGPEYFREIKGPFQDVELLACGGVNSDNLDRFFAFGATGVSFGSSIFRAEWLKTKEYERVGEAVKRFINRFEVWKDQNA